MSKRNSLVTAAIAKLNTSRPGGIPEAVHTRTIGIPATAAVVAITVYPKIDKVSTVHSRATPLKRRYLELWVECVGAANGPTPSNTTTRTADQAVDPLLAWVQRSLGGETFGSVAIGTEEIETVFEYETAQQIPICRATVKFGIDYTTKPDDPDAPAS